MKEQSAARRGEASAPVKIIAAQVLIDRMNEIHDMVAHRAYELFEMRGRDDGGDLDDWLQAEGELVHSCRHDVKESPEAIILRAEVPGTFTPDQLKVSVEPHRLMVSGEQEVSTTCLDAKGSHNELRLRRIFRVHDLPEEVDASGATAILKHEVLEVVMPKVAAANKPGNKAEAASSGA